MVMDYTCKDCLYANFNEDGSVDCDRKVLLTGRMCEIEEENVDKPCPAHSSRDVENWRYVENAKYLHQCDDSCGICRRLVNLNDISQYGYVAVKDKDGKVVNLQMACRICIDKGRG